MSSKSDTIELESQQVREPSASEREDARLAEERQRLSDLAHLRVEIVFIGEQLRILSLRSGTPDEGSRYWARYLFLLEQYRRASGDEWSS